MLCLITLVSFVLAAPSPFHFRLALDAGVQNFLPSAFGCSTLLSLDADVRAIGPRIANNSVLALGQFYFSSHTLEPTFSLRLIVSPTIGNVSLDYAISGEPLRTNVFAQRASEPVEGLEFLPTLPLRNLSSISNVQVS